MKKILIAAILITSGIIASCSRQQTEERVIKHSAQVVFASDMKNIATAD